MEDKNTLVRRYILDMLERKEWTSGEKLPGARSIAGVLGFSLLTVQNALDTLTKEGILRSVARQGTYVDPGWQTRILQSNMSFYIPLETLPWGELFQDRLGALLPHLHLCRTIPHSVFEIVTTAEGQTRHGQYLDMDPLLRKCFPDRSDFCETILESFYYDGKLAGIPIVFSPRVMFYNPTMLAEADCPVPSPEWTWDDFLNCVRRLLRRFSPDRVFPWSASYYLWMNMVLRSGGTLIDPSAADPVRIDSAETCLGLARYRELRRELGVRRYNDLQLRQFEHGELAFAVDARQRVGRLRKIGNTNWDVLPLPSIVPGCESSMLATELLCVRRECVDLTTVETLISLVLSEEFQNHIADLKYAVPLRKSSTARSFADDDAQDRLFQRETSGICSHYNLNSEELFRLVVGRIGELLWNDEELGQATAELARMVRLFLRINKTSISI